MQFSRRLIAPILRAPSNAPVECDLGAFVMRLILFEHYILSSVRLLELPPLMAAFTFNGLIDILESGALSIDSLPVQTASLGPNLFTTEPPPSSPRPPFHYSLATISPGDITQHVNLCLNALLPSMDISSRKAARLRRAIYGSLAPIPEDVGDIAIQSTASELLSSPTLLASACSIGLAKGFGLQVDAARIKIEIQRLSPHDFVASSNLPSDLGLAQLPAHKAIESAILAVAHRNDRLEQMKHHSALIGFEDQELPLLGDKLAFLERALSPQGAESRLSRVIQLRGLPSIPANEVVKLDARALLSIRGTQECILFRDWLATTGTLSDDEVAHHECSIAHVLGSFIRSPAGRAIRFLVTSGVGSIPAVGLAVGIPLSAIDQFVLEKLLPAAGATAFIDELYPSVFD